MKICTFASGCRGNCTLISLNGRNFLIDAGISMRRICSALSDNSLTPKDIDAILITHQHSDHISGLRMLTKHYPIKVICPKSTALYLLNSLSCPHNLIEIMPAGSKISFGDVNISSFSTSHDTEESVGYRIEGEQTFSFATDTGFVSDEVYTGLKGADAVVIEANHDIDMLRFGNYPYHLKKRILSPCGHLSNDDCANLVSRLCIEGTKYFILAHLSRENNTPAKAYSSVSPALSGSDAKIYVAPEAEIFTLEIGGENIC